MGLLAILVFVLAGVFGAPAAGMLNARNPFSDPGSQSARAEALVQRLTGKEVSPGVLAVIAARPGTVAVSTVAKAIGAVSGVASVSAPVPGQRSPLVSADGRSSVVAATLQAAPNPNNVVKAIESALSGRHDVVLGGADVAGYQTGQQALADLGLAEALAFPLLAILALLIFRGLATLLPLAAGGMSVLVTFLVLRLVNEALPLSVFALNLVIGLGLGLSVDYTLFLVSRFRDELQDGRAVPEALRATLVSTGRTVLFSATTVAAALACLTIFPQRFLVSMGLGGAVVALVAAFSALLVVPALLMLFGARLGRKARSGTTSGSWYRLASAVMRRPWLFAAGTAVVLLLLASPAPKVRWSGIDATVLPTTKSARVAQDLLDRDFPGLHGGQPLLVVAEGPPSSGPALAGYVARLASLPGVSSVSAPRAIAPGTWEITLADQADPISAKAQATVATVRALPAPATVLVGGAAADFYDQRATVDNTLPVALGALAGVVLLVLWAMTGSLVLPFKTLLMNGLTAAAATGILVFIFQDGRLAGLLSYMGQGGIEETDFLVLAALAFALSTDYGVFLLARIKESRPGRTEREAVAVGMQRTGRLVTNASLLLAVAIGAFATSHLVFLKEVGVGTAAAVLLDAFLVRALLVPSLMALLGRWNWWAPRPLQRLHSRLGFGEADL